MHGSGFRIAPDLLLTNWHVLHEDVAHSEAFGRGRSDAQRSAYIVQHPGGDRKRLGFVRDHVRPSTTTSCTTSQTAAGVSGSSVFEAEGRSIALHHARGTPQVVADKPPT